MDNIEVISLSTYIFMVYLLLALFVERSLEIGVAVFQYAEWRWRWFEFWNRKAAQLQQRFEHYQKVAAAGGPSVQQLLNDVLAKWVTEPAYPGGPAVVSAALVRLNGLRIGTRVVGFLLALLLVWTQHVDFIQILYRIFEEALPQQKILVLFIESSAFRLGITAAAISIGAEPLHQMISKVESFVARKTQAPPGEMP